MKIGPISINNGLFLGIILVIFTLVLSYTNPTMFIKSKTMLLSMPFIIILIKAANEFRRSNGGLASFGQLFNITFFCGAIAVLICSIFEFLLFNYINPELAVVEKAIQIEALEQTKSLFGEGFIENQIPEIESKNMHSLDVSLTNFIFRLIAPVALFSSIVSLILKRNELPFSQNENT